MGRWGDGEMGRVKELKMEGVGWSRIHSRRQTTVVLVIFGLITSVLVSLIGSEGGRVMALPPLEDIPEEILRTEIITEARSPIDGKRLNAAEYAQLQAQLQQSPPPKLAPQIRDQIFLLRILNSFRRLFPFLNF